jgi:hypothetical protein
LNEAYRVFSIDNFWFSFAEQMGAKANDGDQLRVSVSVLLFVPQIKNEVCC